MSSEVKKTKMNNSSLINKYISKLCRLCMNRDIITINLFTFLPEINAELVNLIMECAPAHISRHDDLPNVVCRSCFREVKEIHQFQEKAIESDKILRHHVQLLHAANKQNKAGSSGVDAANNLFELNNFTVKAESLETVQMFSAEELNKFCRLCMATVVTMVNIFKKKLLAESIMKCTSVLISKHDSLPDIICTSCDTKLKKIHQFQTQAIESEHSLRRYLMQLQPRDNQIGSESTTNFIALGIKTENNKDVDSPKLGIKEEVPSIDNADPLAVKEEPLDDIGEGQSSNAGITWKEVKTEMISDSEDRPSNRIESKVNSNGDNAISINDAKKKTQIDLDVIPKFSMIKVEPFGEDQLEVNTSSGLDKKTSDIQTVHLFTNNTVKKHMCNVCNKFFNRLSNLKMHKLSHTGEKPYRCDVCYKCFNQLSAMKRHKVRHTGEKAYLCEVCKKCFTEAGNLKKHMLLHTGEKPYQCDVCSKGFTQLSSLKRHKAVHTGVTFDQSIRDNEFEKPSSLKKNSAHSGEKTHQCDVCNKCFTEAGNLKIHMLIHSGEKPFQCDVCNKCFTQSSSLSKHKLTHTGEKPYKCDVCNKCFAESGNLKKHIRVHTGVKPYRCDVCSKCFNHLSNLKIHKRTHTGEKLNQCDICNDSFIQMSALKKHKLIHTGEKPYLCDICNNCFTQSSNLSKHKLTHIGEKP